MDSLFKGLFDDQDDEAQAQDKAKDFIRRYEEGAPADNIDDEEALRNFHAVAGKVSPQEFEDATAEALNRVPPEERREFANLLKQSGGQDLPDTDDPREIARYTSQVQAQQPDMLEGLLGGLLSGGGQGLGGLLGGNGQGQNQGLGGLLDGVLGGGDNNDARTLGQTQGLGGILQNPMARSSLGGIAAMVMKQLMNKRA